MSDRPIRTEDERRATHARLSSSGVSGPCSCQQISCVCHILQNHKIGCRYRAAVALPFGLECDHGRDVCPVCDPCTCKEIQ